MEDRKEVVFGVFIVDFGDEELGAEILLDLLRIADTGDEVGTNVIDAVLVLLGKLEVCGLLGVEEGLSDVEGLGEEVLDEEVVSDNGRVLDLFEFLNLIFVYFQHY